MCVHQRLLKHLPGLVGLGLAASLLSGCVSTATLPGGGAPTWGGGLSFQASGFRVLGEVEKVYANGLERRLVLATRSRVPGSNFVSAAVLTPGEGTGYGPRLPDVRPASSALDEELATAIPGVRLGRTTAYGENAYGPYGYATGRSARGESCAYGWQRIAGAGRLGQLRAGAVQVRLRVCDNRLTAERIDALMQSYRVGAVGTRVVGGRPFTAATRDRFVDRDLEPVYADAPPVRRRAPAAAEAGATAGMLVLPELGGVAVPALAGPVRVGPGATGAAAPPVPLTVPPPASASAAAAVGSAAPAPAIARTAQGLVPPCAQPGLGALCARPSIVVPPPVPVMPAATLPPGAALRIPPPAVAGTSP